MTIHCNEFARKRHCALPVVETLKLLQQSRRNEPPCCQRRNFVADPLPRIEGTRVSRIGGKSDLDLTNFVTEVKAINCLRWIDCGQI